MTDEFNPYQAPDASVAEDFIAVEPRRRPTINFAAAAVSFGGVAFLILITTFAGCLMIAYPPTGEVSYPRLLLVMAPVGCATLAFFLAGRAFWRMRDRSGVALFLIAVGAFASIFALPLLFP